MNKSYLDSLEAMEDLSDGSKRLYRVVTEVVRYLDESKTKARCCNDLFLPARETQRIKLREYCERLMFWDPVGYGFKTEEILWRKGYYEVFSTAKVLRKENVWSSLEKVHIMNVLIGGIGYYHHIIYRLESEFKLQLQGCVDFPSVQDRGLIKGKFGDHSDPKAYEWAREAVHRCLVYLGDLSRYLQDMHPKWNNGLALRYYIQALNLDPSIGMPHNQLGTLSGHKNYSFDAAYHYVRCLMCLQSFGGAEGNLIRIFDKNAKWLEVNYRHHKDRKKETISPSERIHLLVARFLLLIDVWFFDKSSIPHIHSLCHYTLQDLQTCLNYNKPYQNDFVESNENIDDFFLLLNEGDDDKPKFLKSEMVFKMVTMLLLCITKLKTNGSQQSSSVVAFTLGVFSLVLQQIIHNIKTSVLGLAFHSAERSSETVSPVELPSSASDSAVDMNTNNNENLSNGVVSDDLMENGKFESHLLNGSHSKNDLPSKERKPNKRVLGRRRRRRRRMNSLDSDISESDCSIDSNSSIEAGNSDISENEEPAILSSEEDEDIDDEEEEDDINELEKISLIDVKAKDVDILEQREIFENEITNGPSPVNGSKQYIMNKKEGKANSFKQFSMSKKLESPQRIHAADIIELVMNEYLLDVVKICIDWLIGDEELIKACAQSSRILLYRIINLLNLISVDTDILLKGNDSVFKLKNVTDIFSEVPLPEDVELKGLTILRFAHEHLNWEFLKYNYLHVREEALLRVLKLQDFGIKLTKMTETGIKVDDSSKMFVMQDEKEFEIFDEKNENNTHWKDHPGKRRFRKPRLKKSIRYNTFHSDARHPDTHKRQKCNFSPYLVLDVEAFLNNILIVKQLVGLKKFIVIVPANVISTLDELKKEVSKARDAIRWIESQFQSGNRFLRAQRPNERLTLPLVKYPKKKDKEAWFFFQMVECCYYVTKQCGGIHELSPNTALVSLLTGLKTKDDINKSFSYKGVAASAGISLEHIESFHARWKKSTKSHG